MFCCAPFAALRAQNISSTYVASPQPNGVLYFIVPQSGFAAIGSGTRFFYDITYKTSEDTAVVNFSYFDSKDLTIDSIAIGGTPVIAAPATRLFVEPDGKNWHYRYSVRLPYSTLRNVFLASHTPPEITLFTSTGKAVHRIKKGAWAAQARRISKVFKMIELNKH